MDEQTIKDAVEIAQDIKFIDTSNVTEAGFTVWKVRQNALDTLLDLATRYLEAKYPEKKEHEHLHCATRDEWCDICKESFEGSTQFLGGYNKGIDDSRLFYLKQLDGLEEVIDEELIGEGTVTAKQLADAIRKMICKQLEGLEEVIEKVEQAEDVDKNYCIADLRGFYKRCADAIRKMMG